MNFDFKNERSCIKKAAAQRLEALVSQTETKASSRWAAAKTRNFALKTINFADKKWYLLFHQYTLPTAPNNKSIPCLASRTPVPGSGTETIRGSGQGGSCLENIGPDGLLEF